MQVWMTKILKEGSTDILQFTYKDSVFEVTYAVVWEALHLPNDNEFDAPVGDEAMRNLFTQIEYAESMERLGKMVRPNLMKECSFYFDNIERAITS